MDLFAAAGAQLTRIVSSVPSTHWDKPTPADVTVREVVNHVVGGNVFAVRLLSGASAADSVAGLDADQLGDDPLAAVANSCEAQQVAFATADQTAPLHHLSGDISYETFVRFRLGDVVLHAWDIAIGAGLDPTLDPALVDALWSMVEPHLDDMRAMGVFGTGATNTVPPTASPQSRLLDAFGRRP
ncbi:TIGR03086 family metal-binding protein [Streptomyces sp. SID13031]|uniref:TIGR03086 family metal-binding protein n=1 Tax=Streptomyces sp. SID13031 TaxID=2706046 RepID=UPI0013C63EDD|nr:TIGR03086 family protein [Streptomyces sp. SID13031]